MATSDSHDYGTMDKGKANPSFEDDGDGQGSPQRLTSVPNGGKGGDAVKLERTLGVFSGVAIIVGTMIGSGIFISPTGVMSQSGSVSLGLLVWAGCGVISLFGALSYAELGTLIPMSGGEYPYLLKGYGAHTQWKGDDDEDGGTDLKDRSERQFFQPIPAFLFAWVTNLVLKPSSCAIIALAFAEYTTTPFFDSCGPPVMLQKLTAGACILLVTYINSRSVSLGMTVINVLTVAKIAALVIIIVAGLYRLGQGHTQNLKPDFEKSTDPLTVSFAFYNGLWAYDGWNNLNFVIEELKNPQRNVPICLLLSIPLVTVLYLLVNISYFTVLSAQQLLDSPAVAISWGDEVLGSWSWIIPVAVACSTFGACNGSVFSSGRVNYAAARESHMYGLLAMVSVKYKTPSPGIGFVGLIAILMIIPADILTLIDFFSFTAWLFYGLTALTLIILRFREPYKSRERAFKVPLIVPALVIIFSLYLLIAPLAASPDLRFLWCAVFIVGGLLFYVPLVYYQWRIPGLARLTRWLQYFLAVCPEEEDPKTD